MPAEGCCFGVSITKTIEVRNMKTVAPCTSRELFASFNERDAAQAEWDVRRQRM